MPRLLLFSSLWVLLACSGSSPPPEPPPPRPAAAPAPAPPAAPETSPAEDAASLEAKIQHIRATYRRVLALPVRDLPFDCAEADFTGSFQQRVEGGQLVWARYDVGYAHGSSGFELLMDGGQVLFVLTHADSWHFDVDSDLPETPAGQQSPTVDSVHQERYYFEGDTVLRALQKSALARSVKEEKIDAQLDAAVNEPIPKPDGPKVLQEARAIAAAHQSGELTAGWCGP